MIHCPNCSHLINKSSNFCPYCGVSLQQFIPPRRPKYHHHRIFKSIIVIILLFMIGAGGAYLYKNNMDNKSNGRQSKINHIHTTNTIPNRPRDIQKQKQYQKRLILSKFNRAPKKVTAHPIDKLNRPGYTLSEFPNNIRGTWYTYDQGKLLTITITNNNIVSNGANNPLHARPVNIKHPSNHPDWLICLPPRKVRGINLLQTLGWNQTAGDGESFGLINYKGMPVLEEDGGAESWVDNNFFKSKTQAQQNKKKTLPHEIKRPSM